MKKVSVVILNWNGKDLLERFLPILTQYTDQNLADIIIADNASTDGSVGFLKENYPSLPIIILPRNLGFAEGYNQALIQVDSEYYILLNSDVEVAQGWLHPLINFLDNNENVAAVQPKILSQRNKNYFEYAGASGGFIDKLGYPFCRGRIFASVEKDNAQYNEPKQIFWASGACLAIRSEDYREAGGFDSTFFAHMEEIDLCWRLNARNKSVYCIPQSVVYHIGAATLNKENPHKTYLNFRNNILMLYKNLDENDFKKIQFRRMCLDWLAALQMAVTGNFKNAKAVLSAHKEFRRIKKSYDSIRQDNLDRQIVKNIPTIYPKSLLWQYYAKGAKKFSKLKW